MEHLAAGLGISGETLETVIAGGRQVLDAVGNRISAYVTGSCLLPQLEQAWCDGAFWFHEAISKPLDTVAVPKRGIAMEVLLRGGSAKVSKNRMVSALLAFLNLGMDDLITPTAIITVRQFADNVHEVSARLRHSNWSSNGIALLLQGGWDQPFRACHIKQPLREYPTGETGRRP
jgi:hypothetical protein